MSISGHPELDEAIAEKRHIPGALIPVLQIAQGLFGYLPEHILKRISSSLNISYSEVAGVVGFYSFFSTTPKHIRVAPFQSNHGFPRAGPLNQELIQLLLRNGMFSGPFPAENNLRPRWGHVEQLGIDQGVINHHIGPSQKLRTAEC